MWVRIPPLVQKWYTCFMSRRKYTKEILQEAVDKSFSVMEVLDCLGLARAGGSHSHISSMIRKHGIDTSHFLGKRYNTGKPPVNKRKPEDVLVLKPVGSTKEKTLALRKALIASGVDHQCSECGLKNIWNSKPITLEIDHIDGNWLDNRIENLRFLCPNCHSQQVTTNQPHKNRKTNNVSANQRRR